MNLNNRCLIIKVWLIEVTLYCLNTLLFYFETNTEMAGGVRSKALVLNCSQIKSLANADYNWICQSLLLTTTIHV